MAQWRDLRDDLQANRTAAQDFAQILAMKKHFLSIGASRLEKRGRLS
jgi:hypothetical protein